MRFFAILGICLALASAAVAQKLAPPINPTQVTVIRAGTLIDPRADSPLHTLSITTWNFKPLLLEHPQVAYKLLVELCRRLREAEARAAI